MHDHDSTAPAEVVALLGATNTGKTHRAIERMLEHRSGMLGLPLRLLAREVYERVSARLGERAVALVTGEEKRVPRHPRYWICTAEAMPRDVAVDFMALDEVQLMAHPERGHVFTERVLRWRGSRETWLLGSSTAEALLRRLVPGLSVQRFPRLSRLSHLGGRSLRSLPRRSAVVTFSAEEVYRLADVLKRRKGGAAVVLGLLSPAARNAQVAMYEAGEVDYLVATDAIGMGLNLDIDHVGLASLEKFDGFEHRPLAAAELGQIVGRAGRHTRDGSFGTVSPLSELPPGLVRALERHRFAPLDFAYYRNDELCFDSIDALLRSLAERPPQGPLRRAPDADDVLALQALRREPEIVRRLNDGGATRLLWDVCHIPNYENHIPEHHAQTLAQVFVRLVDHGQLPEDWLDARLRRLDRTHGTLHDLTARIAAVRTWSYLAHQADWLARPGPLRARARELEDRLSQALHDCLRARFVEPRSSAKGARRAGSSVARRAGAQGPFAKLAEHALYVDADTERQRAEAQWVEALVNADHETFVLDEAGRVAFEGERVAQLVSGAALLRPGLRLHLPEWVEGGMRRRIERRLSAYAQDMTAELVELLEGGESAAQRGLLYQLRQNLGTVSAREARAQLDALDAHDRTQLLRRGVVFGRRVVFARHSLSDTQLTRRRALCRVAGLLEGAGHVPTGRPCVLRDSALSPQTYLRLGYWASGGHAVRCDVLEQLTGELARLRDAAASPAAVHACAAGLLDVDGAEAERVIGTLRKRRRRRRHLR